MVDDEGFDPAQRPHRRSGLLVWFAFWIGLFAFSALWCLATPLGSGPDEADHLVRASALMHGQLVGEPVNGVTAYTRVRVTGAYASTIALPACYAFRPNVPAGCSPAISSSNRLEPTIIYVGRFPPFYYAMVGWPTRFVSDPTVALYVVRLLNAIVNCGFLALALCLAVRARSPKFLVVGVVTATTPMVLYLTGVINPNSVEISAAVCLWTAAILLTAEMKAGELSRSVLRIVVVASAVLTLVRTDSLLWVLVIAAALSPLLVRSGVPWRRLAHRRDVRVGIGAVSAAGVVLLLWTLTQHTRLGGNPPPPNSASFLNLARGAVGQASGWIVQAIGYFGWFDARAPLLTVVVWIAATGCLVLCGVSYARWRERAALMLTLAAAVVVPLVLVLAVARQYGYIGLGRYFLPLFVGIPIVASVSMGPAIEALDGARRLAGTLLMVLGAGQVLAFWWALHRYLVGQEGPFAPTATVAGGWAPPLPAALLDIIYAALVLLATVALGRFLGRGTMDRDTTGEPDSTPLPSGSGRADGLGALTSTTADQRPVAVAPPTRRPRPIRCRQVPP